MKRVFLALVVFSFFSASAQTVDEVIQKYTANMGGMDAFNKIKTLKITGTYTTQGYDLPLTINIVNGKAFRADVEAMGTSIVRVYKDGKGWTINPMAGSTTATDITGADLNTLKSQATLASGLMDYKARGNQVELQGQADVEGVKTYKIKFTNKDDGKVTYYYISSSDYTMVKAESEVEVQGKTANVEVFFSDLKEFGGVKFFMTRSQKMDGQVFQTTTYSNIDINPTIDEKIFDKP
ncbi:MAG: outer membrane lipoprotein-sorting protein [Bacteroidetes bacterium]|jgi:hypothetical protein|nr:MAG: outer membrane lipoprotein-sorting protein [Bacteroidota bacterium]